MPHSLQTIKVKIAVAGLGRMGKRHVRTLLHRVPNADIVAVCSTDPEELAWARKEYENWGIEVYDSYDDMIQHTGLQAVWVSTSTNVHASQTLAAISKDLHVLCEKPLSIDVDEVCATKFSNLPKPSQLVPLPALAFADVLSLSRISRNYIRTNIK